MRKSLLLPLAVLATVAAPAAAKPTRAFLHDAIQGDNSEMRLGSLAAARGHSAGTRAFGRMLVRDHSMAKRDAVALARRDRVPVPAGMAPEAARERVKLNRLRGAAFDREFARYMVEDHTKDIAEFAEQARTGREGTAALARATLPHLRAHLRTARSLT